MGSKTVWMNSAVILRSEATGPDTARSMWIKKLKQITFSVAAVVGVSGTSVPDLARVRFVQCHGNSAAAWPRSTGPSWASRSCPAQCLCYGPSSTRPEWSSLTPLGCLSPLSRERTNPLHRAAVFQAQSFCFR